MAETIDEITADVYRNYRPVLEKILSEKPEGLSEYSLIQELAQNGRTEFKDALRSGVLELFQSHFLLFHLLYRLRLDLMQERSVELKIDVLEIRILPRQYATTTEGLEKTDPLQLYYMDASNLSNTTRQDVEKMLSSFWGKFQTREEVQGALEILELEDSADYDQIKARYRTLALERHPDRGGSEAQFQELNRARDILDRHYS